MKTSKYILLFIIALIVSCDYNDKDYEYDSGWFIAFEEIAITELESKGTVEINVMLAEGGRKEEVTVNFEISSDDAQEGVHYEIVEPTDKALVFKTNESIAKIKLKLVDDMSADGDKQLSFNLTSNSKNYHMGMPGPDNLNKLLTFTIKEDDCPFDTGLFSGKPKSWETSPWWTDIESNSYEYRFVEADGQKFTYMVKGIFCTQLFYSYNAWVGSEAFNAREVKIIFDLTDPANPKMTIPDNGAGAAQTSYEVDWGGDGNYTYYTVKPVTDEPISVITCDGTMAFKYSMANPSWASNLSLKFDFNK